MGLTLDKSNSCQCELFPFFSEGLSQQIFPDGKGAFKGTLQREGKLPYFEVCRS